ncbi:two component transcriptional regulator, winged helix family [Candidatus Koribacter versatilis Ellin345]|uniref:Two component transcriptional regulator, winged helix family n=1 Tax=Koribacter versatilis (strain Ellin345) TaxID=204669 RepID=Q1IIY2_KORVE|nr:response regulator transcription factor [Candidatus Koribacter versatilis]ABF43168.1 two component transcriptional regulator, winged helix family [Candidatus Koribacter versatilis Ellin345]
MSRILIVEDEEHLARGLQFNLQAEDHEVEVAGTGELALDLLLNEKQHFDVMVLDIMLPGKDGFTVARELRDAQNFIPILMLTARGRSEDILQGFEAGTDDYLPKPFELAILTARLDSLLRRRRWSQKVEAPVEPEVLRFNGKFLDFDALELHVGDQVHNLTLMEAQLLQYLIRSAGRPVSRKSILEEVWGLHEDTDTRAIDNFIVRLRRYIEADPSHPKHLQTVRGIGYRFNTHPEN